ncbi:MAG: hypothetical protein HY056_02040 [Proteobacteria bacterium]|nr:hypothetical protein [Pseudomonadota bacterium]
MSRAATAAVFFTALAVLALSASAPRAQSTGAAFAPRAESPEEFPAGDGRDETFYTCTACHNFQLVAAQGMTRRQWDESIELMMQRHNMPQLDTKDRKVILDYLEATYSPRAAERTGGWQNPFLKR